MPESKVYAIFYDDNHMYVPIKRDGYCKDMPQFFGGTANTSETPVAALRREVREESQGKYKLADTFTLSAEYKVYESGEYSFYKIRADVTANFVAGHTDPFTGEGVICLLNKEDATAAEKEHICILKIPKTQFSVGTATGRAAKLRAFCADNGFCKDSTGEGEFNADNCHTRQAFKRFLDTWHA